MIYIFMTPYQNGTALPRSKVREEQICQRAQIGQGGSALVMKNCSLIVKEFNLSVTKNRRREQFPPP
jgi:hypothetical protein